MNHFHIALISNNTTTKTIARLETEKKWGPIGTSNKATKVLDASASTKRCSTARSAVMALLIHSLEKGKPQELQRRACDIVARLSPLKED